MVGKIEIVDCPPLIHSPLHPLFLSFSRLRRPTHTHDPPIDISSSPSFCFTFPLFKFLCSALLSYYLQWPLFQLPLLGSSYRPTNIPRSTRFSLLICSFIYTCIAPSFQSNSFLLSVIIDYDLFKEDGGADRHSSFLSLKSSFFSPLRNIPSLRKQNSAVAAAPKVSMRVASKQAYICRDCGYLSFLSAFQPNLFTSLFPSSRSLFHEYEYAGTFTTTERLLINCLISISVLVICFPPLPFSGMDDIDLRFVISCLQLHLPKLNFM